MKRKVLSLLVVAAMAVTMLAGCGGSDKAADSGDGSKKELKKAGLLKNLSGGKLDPEGIDLSLFKQMDLRKVQEFKIDSYKPKILTTHPKSSYELYVDEDSDDDVSFLKIKDPSSFWSMSNFLIIQL